MTDKTIQKGDKGKPSGTTAEVKTDGKLEIDSAGKKIHKNADAANPAVHVAHEDGNDVVKRASELTMEPTAAAAATDDAKNPADEKKDEDEVMKDADATAGAATAGSKREREEKETAAPADAAANGKPAKEQEAAEKEAGKETKRPKLDEEAKKAEVNGGKKPAEEKKDDKKQDEKKDDKKPEEKKDEKKPEKQQDAVKEPAAAAAGKDTTAEPVKELPKQKQGTKTKSSKAEEKAAGISSTDSPATRTRSKGS